MVQQLPKVAGGGEGQYVGGDAPLLSAMYICSPV